MADSFRAAPIFDFLLCGRTIRHPKSIERRDEMIPMLLGNARQEVRLKRLGDGLGSHKAFLSLLSERDRHRLAIQRPTLDQLLRIQPVEQRDHVRTLNVEYAPDLARGDIIPSID